MLAILKFSFKPHSFKSLSILSKVNTSRTTLCNFCVLSQNTTRTFRALHNLNFVVQANRSSFKNRFCCYSTNPYDPRKRRTTLNYVVAAGLLCTAMSFAAVPLYRMFCSAYSYAGTVSISEANERVAEMKPDKDKLITIKFNADISSSMRWNFKPLQREIIVRPGETALAFYTATNPTNVPITGVSSYNVLPFEAGQYFVKIQCFCFEEQQLNPHEQVDMPVFFYIDPDFSTDPRMEYVNDILLSYTFFEAKEGSKLLDMIPSYARKHLLPNETSLPAS